MNTELPSNAYFQRQIILKDFGEETQHKLLKAKVLVIGAGGLGCPALQYLAAMGIGTLGIVDGDKISLSNLHRQILFSSNDIGQYKTEVAKAKLSLNKITSVLIYTEFITQSNALDIIDAFDVVIDCTDNFESRYIINDACVLLKKPWVFGAVFQYEGQAAVYNLRPSSVQYRDLFPIPPAATDAPNCNQSGVFNITTGIIGMLQACEAVKIITDMGNILSNKLLIYNALQVSFFITEIHKNKKTGYFLPKTREEFEQYPYQKFCGIAQLKDEISVEEFEQLIDHSEVQLVDIRHEEELPKVPELNALRIPLENLRDQIQLLDKKKKVILFCHSGIRTETALDILQHEFDMSNVSHLKGGIVKWIDYHTKKS